MSELIPAETIERRILLVRGQKVMLDAALADLYQVPTKVLNQAVKRNLDRFPEYFMFRLTSEEVNQSQFVTGSQKHRDPRRLPYAFTEQGVAMLSSVLKSARAVQVNIAIMRIFVRLRQMLETHRDLAERLQAIEQKYDRQFEVVFQILDQLMETPSEPEAPKQPIGFVA
jgi:flagellar capping protein FliD